MNYDDHLVRWSNFGVYYVKLLLVNSFVFLKLEIVFVLSYLSPGVATKLRMFCRVNATGVEAVVWQSNFCSKRLFSVRTTWSVVIDTHHLVVAIWSFTGFVKIRYLSVELRFNILCALNN